MDRIRNSFRFQKSGQFYLLDRELTDQIVGNLFDAVVVDQNLRAAGAGPNGIVLGPHSNNANVELRDVRRAIPGRDIEGHTVEIRCSLILRSFEHSPTFAPRSGLVEITYAYLMLTELTVSRNGDRLRYLFIQRDGALDPMKHGFREFTTEIDLPAFLNQFIADQPGTISPTRIEKMAMRMMASTQGEIRQKVIDSHDVVASTSSLGLHRTIAGNMTVTRQTGAKSQQLDLSPHRHRVRTGASRISYDGLMSWKALCAVGFFTSKDILVVASPFLAQMAQPLMDLIGKEPSSLFIERHRFNAAISRFSTSTGKAWEAHPRKSPPGLTLDDLLEQLSEPLPLSAIPCDKSGNPIAMNPVPKEVYYFPEPRLASFAGNDSLKVRVTPKTCRVLLPKGAGQFVPQNGQDDPTPLEEVLNETLAFRVVFDRGSALFCSEGAFRSSNIALATSQLSKIFRPIPALAAVESEKGNVVQASTRFSPMSAFHVIESDHQVTAPGSFLICDDSTDEWCDYLEISATEPRMRWIHAKVQRVETPQSRALRAQQDRDGRPLTPRAYGPVSLERSLSATDLQEVVGQATKNMARLRISSSDTAFAQRGERWLNQNCTLPAASSITRLRRGAIANIRDMEALFDLAATNPMSTYEVAIVVPNYSSAHLTNELGNIQAGTASLSTIQAFWLLSGFMHACLEVGARPLIFMQP